MTEEGVKEYRLKVIVVGSLGTGKTSIIKRYVNNYFSRTYKATVGVDFALKVVNVDPKTKVYLQLWDIAGQERFGTMTKIYYKKAVGALIVFDVTDMKTFHQVGQWVTDIREKLRGPDIPILLLGNKSDLAKESKMGPIPTQEQVEEVVQKNNFIGWKYTSAKENINITESIDKLLEAVLEGLRKAPEGDKDDDKIVLGASDSKTPSSNTNGHTSDFCGCVGGGGGDDN